MLNTLLSQVVAVGQVVRVVAAARADFAQII
jgi:hypothetical protein